MDATGIATDMVKGIANAIIAAVIKQIKDVVELDQSLQLLNTDFGYMNSMLLHIDQQFQAQQRRLPEPIEVCLGRMSNALNEGQQLINRANGQRRRCFGCCLLCNPNLFTQIRDWRTRFDKLFQEFEGVFSIIANTEHIVSTAAPQAEFLRQDVPDDIVGSAIGSAQVKLQTWLTEPAHNQSGVIGIYGIGGVGKTTVLKAIHDNYKKVSGIFDIVIWFTVSNYKPEKEDDKIKELQASIAYTLNVDLKDCPTLDIRKMKLSASLEKKRFLIILDDMWRKMDLVKVGVKFGHDKGSKVLISSRRVDVIKTMGASAHYCWRMQHLSAEDGWKLFRRKAFANGAVPEKGIETIAEEIAKECKGLPLALNVVAAALSGESDLNKWRDALASMRNVDPSFPDTHSTIDAELYQRLRWSYNDLSDTLKSCFLYIAAFPEDAEIDVQTLVEMWSAEGLLIRRGISSLMDVGRQYIDELVGRCLIEHVGVKKINIQFEIHGWATVEKEVIKVHDVLRDTAIYIGERDEHWVFASGQHLQNFPREEVTRNCKRLSIGHNDIKELPTDLECTELLSLILANCPKLTKVPAASFLNIMSLKVLDLSCTLITSLPTSVGQLGQLEFLNLTGCYLLNELPETICSLFRLQFLNLDFCHSLGSLPDNIGELKSLKHFSFEIRDDMFHSFERSTVIPRSIFGLTSLTKLCLPSWAGCAISMEDLINLSNLVELSIAVKAHTMSNCDWTWLKMRKLVLRFEYDANARRDAEADSNVAVDDGDNVVVKDADGDEDDVVEDGDDVVEDGDGDGDEDGDGDADADEDGDGDGDGDADEDADADEDGDGDADEDEDEDADADEDADGDEDDVVEDAVMLDTLPLENMNELQSLSLIEYRGLSLPNYICKFQNLEKLRLMRCPELRELPVLEIGSDSFPMLKKLVLFKLDKLESITNVLNGGAMSKLQYFEIMMCPLLKRLPIGIEKLCNLKEISGERRWWSDIIWEDEATRVKLQPLFRNYF